MTKNIIYVIKKLLLPFVILLFWYHRWVKHNYFLLRSPQLTKPNPLSLPFVILFIVWEKLIVKTWKLLFADYGIPVYKRLTFAHYAPGGPGYFDFKSLTPQKKQELYNSLYGRISYFLDDTLPPYINDGDSILDVGCGIGQNLKTLHSAFPNSNLSGFDLKDDILEIGRLYLPNVAVWTGDFTDADFMDRIDSSSYDWVLMSHALGFIMSNDTIQTLQLRQKTINSLCRIAKKGVILLDGVPTFGHAHMHLIIEQNTRALLTDDFTSYFNNLPGHLVMRRSPESLAYIFILKEK